MIDKLALGAKIKELRVRAGKSQEELGQLLNKSHAAVSDIERGKTEVTVRDLSTLAEFLGVKVQQLVDSADASKSAFKPITNFRDSKDMTPEEKIVADKSSDDFLKHIMEKFKEDLES